MVKKRKTGQPRIKVQRAKEYLIAYPTATDRMVMEAVDCSRRTVGNARKSLIDAGLIPRAPGTRGKLDNDAAEFPTLNTSPPTDPLSEESSDEMLRRLLPTSGTPEEVRASLLRIAAEAKINGQPTLEMSAYKALRDHDRDQKITGKLGPGSPLTDEGKIDRLSCLIEVCGPSITTRAALKRLTLSELEALHRDLGIEIKALQEEKARNEEVDDAAPSSGGLEVPSPPRSDNPNLPQTSEGGESASFGENGVERDP